MNVKDNDVYTLSKTHSEIVFIGYSCAAFVDRVVPFMLFLNMTPVTIYPVMCTLSVHQFAVIRDTVNVAVSNRQLIYMSAENIIRY